MIRNTITQTMARQHTAFSHIMRSPDSFPPSLPPTNTLKPTPHPPWKQPPYPAPATGGRGCLPPVGQVVLDGSPVPPSSSSFSTARRFPLSPRRSRRLAGSRFLLVFLDGPPVPPFSSSRAMPAETSTSTSTNQVSFMRRDASPGGGPGEGEVGSSL